MKFINGSQVFARLPFMEELY